MPDNLPSTASIVALAIAVVSLLGNVVQAFLNRATARDTAAKTAEVAKDTAMLTARVAEKAAMLDAESKQDLATNDMAKSLIEDLLGRVNTVEMKEEATRTKMEEMARNHAEQLAQMVERHEADKELLRKERETVREEKHEQAKAFYTEIAEYIKTISRLEERVISQDKEIKELTTRLAHVEEQLSAHSA